MRWHVIQKKAPQQCITQTDTCRRVLGGDAAYDGVQVKNGWLTKVDTTNESTAHIKVWTRSRLLHAVRAYARRSAFPHPLFVFP
jgi:hypothetical protein